MPSTPSPPHHGPSLIKVIGQLIFLHQLLAIHPIDANFYRFHQLIQYPLCLHPNPPLHLPNQFFIVSPFCLFLRSCLEAACKDSKVGKHGDNEVAGANIEGQHFVPKRQTLSPIYALAKILKEYMR